MQKGDYFTILLSKALLAAARYPTTQNPKSKDKACIFLLLSQKLQEKDSTNPSLPFKLMYLDKDLEDYEAKLLNIYKIISYEKPEISAICYKFIYK